MTDRLSIWIFALILLACSCYANAVPALSPFMALGNAQFFDNNGQALTAGVLYSYQAGTTTQQATFTDYTGATMNPNPIPFGSGARVNIWLTSSASYKFVLCLQNDGAFCAPADILFSVDHVPGCGGCATGGSPYIGTFISGSPSPATTGILELASTDAICWRNTAGTTNLCITKDTSDILDWTGGTIKLPELGCGPTASGYDYLCPNSAIHRLSISNNNNPYGAVPTVPVPGTSGHHASFTSTGYDLQDLGGIDPVDTAVTYSATPTFTATSQDQLFTMTLTGNVTSSTLVMAGMPVPSLVTFELTQDATGSRTFVWPTNVLNAPTIASPANTVTVAHFVWDGTNAYNVAPTPPQTVIAFTRTTLGSTVSVPATTPTTVMTITGTTPLAGCPCRALVYYGVQYASANSLSGDMWVTDGTHVWATAPVTINGTGLTYGLNNSAFSPTTYANNTSFTLTLTIEMSGNGLTVATGFGFGGESSNMSVSWISSN